jgi:DAK2 domain fusion protein YloV
VVPEPRHRDAAASGDLLDAAAARRWLAYARTALAEQRGHIDALNVFPVPDGDTGSNLLHTWDAVLAALPAVGPDERLADVLAAAAQGALLGARGNSGVIVCQIVHGLAAALPVAAADGPQFAGALRRAVEGAREAVVEPVEGTILTVAAAAATAAGNAAAGGLDEVVRAALAGARAALQRTPQQLAALADAGVVDAGGQGFVVLLAALAQALDLDGTAASRSPTTVAGALPAVLDIAASVDVRMDRSGGSPTYEVQYLFEADQAGATTLRHALGRLGDSVAVAGGPQRWTAHVHTNEPGAAVEAGMTAGVISRIAVEALQERVGPGAHPGPGPSPGRVVVALVSGSGLAGIFAAAGARVLDASVAGQPDTLRAALTTEPAGEVVVLPNEVALIPVVQQVAAQLRTADRADRAVVVVPTRSPVQGLAALAVADATLALTDAVVTMADAAAATRVGELSIADVTGLTTVGTCRPGDVLAMQSGEVVLIGGDLTDVACMLVDRLLDGGGEMVTLVAGEGATAGLTDAVAAHVGRQHPFVEVVVYDGAQPSRPLLIGVE